MEPSKPVLLAPRDAALLRVTPEAALLLARRDPDQEDPRRTVDPALLAIVASSRASPVANAAWLPTDDAVEDPLR